MISLKDLLILTKFKLSFTVSLSLVFGFLLAKHHLNYEIISPFLAVLFLALGVSCLNQVQEFKEDSLMTRTKNRPIASKRISPKLGMIIALFFIAPSFLFIYLSLELIGIYIFILVIILYNYFYTRAKKTSMYGSVWGAILGVIPPLIGWLSANESLLSLQFFALALFYFIWQIPHFWLLALKYNKDYKKADFPTLVDKFGKNALERITFIWLLLTIVSGLYLILVFDINSLWILGLLLVLNIFTLYNIFNLRVEHKYLKNFIIINIYMLFTMILLIFDKMLFS